MNKKYLIFYRTESSNQTDNPSYNNNDNKNNDVSLHTHFCKKKLIICHQCSYGQIMTQGKYFKSLEIEGSFLFDG